MAIWLADAGVVIFPRVAKWLREPRSRLVAIYAAVVALGYAIHALPGGLDYANGTGELVFWLVVDVILIALIAGGSRVVAAVLLVLNIGFLLSVTLVSSASDLASAEVIAFAVVLLAQCVVLTRLVFWRTPAAAPAL